MPPRVGLTFNALPQVGAEVRKLLSAVVLKVAADVEAAAKDKAPVDTGNLRNSIQHRRVGELEAEVNVGAEYGAAVEFGTGIHTTDPEADGKPIIIEPRKKKALFWPGAEHPVRRVVQEGQPPRPYLVPAVEDNRQVFEAACAQAIEAGAREAARKRGGA